MLFAWARNLKSGMSWTLEAIFASLSTRNASSMESDRRSGEIKQFSVFVFRLDGTVSALNADPVTVD
jgi:hypothetical protein